MKKKGLITLTDNKLLIILLLIAIFAFSMGYLVGIGVFDIHRNKESITSIVTPVSIADADADFESLFFGTGAWLGLLLFMIISVALVAISKYCAVFVVIITIMMEMEYYTRLDEYGNHAWKMIILLFFALFICLTAVLDKRR